MFFFWFAGKKLVYSHTEKYMQVACKLDNETESRQLCL